MSHETTHHATVRVPASLDVAPADVEGVTVRRVGPTGADALDPAVLVTRDGRTAFHGPVAPERARDLVDAAVDGLPADGATAVVEHDPEAERLPVPADGPLSVGRRRALARCGWFPPGERAGRERTDARTLRETVAESGLLGRGRGDVSADEPVAPVWDDAAAAGGDPVVVVNALEADPRVRADRLLLAGAAWEVIDAAVALADAVDATDVVVAVGDTAAADAARTAAAGDWSVSVQAVAGPDDYLAAEPTMAVEALEGKERLEARRRPPSPAVHGLHGRPTLVHTPRTLAAARALRDGYDPDAADPGTRLVTVTGDVDAPATVELPTGGSLAAVRDAVTLDGRFKMACVGGRFGGLTRDLDRPPSPGALSPDLGTEGAVELLDDSRCAVATAGRRSQGAADDNCGRCVPCREGTTQLTELLRETYDGRFRDDDVRELARTVRRTSLCSFGRHAVRPVASAVAAFETEFRAHAEGRCPAGVCS